MKVKNIMFFGFAAAILSAASANAAQQGYTFAATTTANAGTAEGGYSGSNIVAAKSYVDLKGDQLKVDINNIATTAGNAVPANAAIDPGTHTKITYDANGLVTAGEDITLSDVTDVTATASEVNQLHNSNVTTSDLTKLHNVTADAAELNILDGATLTTTELNYVDGVTSSIQDQLDAKELETNKVKQGAATGSVLTSSSSDTEYPSAKVVYTAIQDVAGTAANAVVANEAITAGTHTKITYDSKGLVTAGEDITLSDVTDVTATASEVNQLHNSNVTTSDLTKLHNVTADAAELNILDGATLTTTELNYVDGVTSSIQDQLDSKLGASAFTTGTEGAHSIKVNGTDVEVSEWPTQSGVTCSSTTPCALVDDGTGTGGKIWRPMAI